MSSKLNWTYESIPDDEDRVLDYMNREQSSKKSYSRIFNLMYCGGVIFGILVIYSLFIDGGLSSSTIDTDSSHTTDVIDTEEALPIFEYTLKRAGYEPLEYFPIKNDTFTYHILKGHIGIIEPSAPTKFHYFGEEPVRVDYQVCPTTSSDSCATGTYENIDGQEISTTVRVKCDQYSTFQVTVRVYSSKSGSLIYKDISTALCMSVRREIRSLLPADQDLYFKTTYLLHTTDLEEGRQLYGSSFKNAEYMLRWHFFSAGQQDADHLHGGNGFLTQHVTITNMYEKALQAIDESMALPYWDFTVDYAAGDTVMEDSYAMRKGTFGAMTHPANLRKGFTYLRDKIKDGRIPNSLFENFTVGQNTEYTEMKYTYGYLRAPWNMNPSPYISRFQHGSDISHKTLPTCTDYYTILQYNNQIEAMFDTENDPHANLHLMAGGLYGCDTFQSLWDDGLLTTNRGFDGYVCIVWPLLIKILWRSNSIEISRGCEIKEPLEDSYCPLYCLDEERVRFVAAGFLQGKVKYDDWGPVEDRIVEFICSTPKKNGIVGSKVFAGDMAESASPADPMFWFIHPTLERIFHYKYVIGGFAETYWPSDPLAEYVCASPSCYNVTQGATGEWEDCCMGHFIDDSLMDPDFNDRTVKMGSTNGATAAALSAGSADYAMPYIYESLKWDHCDEDFEAFGRKHFDAMQNYRALTEGQSHVYEQQRAAATVAAYHEKHGTKPPSHAKGSAEQSDWRHASSSQTLRAESVNSGSSASAGEYANRKLEEAQERSGLKATALQKARREWKQKSKGHPIPYQFVEPFPNA